MEAGQRGKSDSVSKVERDYSSSQKKEGGGGSKARRESNKERQK